eukprot:scaffold45819_cov50-Prasinocladus_malaysianus.AAC.2
MKNQPSQARTCLLERETSYNSRTKEIAERSSSCEFQPTLAFCAKSGQFVPRAKARSDSDHFVRRSIQQPPPPPKRYERKAAHFY